MYAAIGIVILIVMVFGGFALTGGTYYTGKQYSDEANQHSLPSFTTFDAGARYRAQLGSNNSTRLPSRRV